MQEEVTGTPGGIAQMCVQGTGCGTDVDHGDPRALLEQFAAWADLPSRRGRHAYYDDDTPRANATWAALGCRGDIRGAKGYLVLHEDGCERLAEALDHRVPGTRPFPRDLFDLGLGDPAVASAPVPTLKRGPLPVRDAGAVVDLPLDRVWPGARHNTHFDQVRWWAYAQARGDDLRAWLARVESYALRQNERFPVPVPEVDALATARSVATWVWSGGGSFDHGYVAQARRGTASGKVRRYLTRERDRWIVARLDAGESQRSVARAFGVDHRTVGTARARLSRTWRAPRGGERT